MRILVCTDKVPYPLHSGDTLRMYNIFGSLSRSNDVYLFCFKTARDSQQDLETIENSSIFKGCFYLDLPAHSTKGRAIDLLLSRPGLFWRLRYPKLEKQAKVEIRRIIEEKNIDVLHVHSAFIGLLLADFAGIPRVLDLTDSLSLQCRRKLQLTPNPFNLYLLIRMKGWERYLLSNFYLTTVVSTSDAGNLRKVNQRADIRVIPNGVDMDYFSPFEEVEEDYPSILFSGTMSYAPNIEAVLYIYKDILPLIRAQIPETKFYIVGTAPSPEVRKLAEDNHIIVTGFVEDIRQYILKSSVVLAPMRSGSGLKNKILEAMALGRPVITNPLGIEWMEQDDREGIIVAETPSEIAQKSVELLNDKSLREHLGKRALQIVREKYTWDICARRFEDVYEDLAKGRKKGAPINRRGAK